MIEHSSGQGMAPAEPQSETEASINRCHTAIDKLEAGLDGAPHDDRVTQCRVVGVEFENAFEQPRKPETQFQPGLSAESESGDRNRRARPVSAPAARPAPLRRSDSTLAEQFTDHVRRSSLKRADTTETCVAAGLPTGGDQEPVVPSGKGLMAAHENFYQYQLNKRLRAALTYSSGADAEARLKEASRKTHEKLRRTESKQRGNIASAVSRGKSRSGVLDGVPNKAPENEERRQMLLEQRQQRQEQRQLLQDWERRAFERRKHMLGRVFDRPMLVEQQGIMAKADTNYYKLLQVEQDATSQQIQESYHRLLQRCVETSQLGLDADLTYDLEEAFTALMDPVLRREHDETLSDGNSPPQGPPMDKKELERLKKKQEEAIETERMQWQLLHNVVEAGRARSPLAGIHKVHRTDGSKPFQQILVEKKTEMEATCRDQWAKIREIKARAADRERAPPIAYAEPLELLTAPSAASIKFECELEKRLAERKSGARKDEQVQRQILRDALDRGWEKAQLVGSYKVKRDTAEHLEQAKQKRQQQLTAESKAQWAHLKEMKARVASRERQYT